MSDNGIGLTPAQKRNIFEPFLQATSSTSRKYGGTGLGLTISSKMVELMGGSLEVESKENEGSTFFFTLHLEKDKEKISDLTEILDFSDLSIGLALPSKSINRQIDINRKKYICYYGASFKIYYYDEIFEKKNIKALPDIMLFDHHYARLPGELEACSRFRGNSILLTSANLKLRIDPEKHKFLDIILVPMNISKTLRIFKNASVVDKVKIQEESIEYFI